MKSYIDIIADILLHGKWKRNRTGVDALTIVNRHWEHRMKDGFPLLTTKKMPIKTILVELEGFIKGITDKSWYQERGCRIWDHWANPIAVDENWYDHCEYMGDFTPMDGIDRKKHQFHEKDLGPIYGYQWRAFNKTYIKTQPEEDGDYTCYTDQLKVLTDKLLSNPDDRRLVVSAWNPNQMGYMALPPCHFAFCCTHVDGKLNLHWIQRSCDLMLGVPFNIASYSALLCLLCAHSGLKPGKISATFCDCHIYENHIDKAREQFKREPFDLPNFIVPEESIYEWNHNKFELQNYNYHPKIDFGGVAV